MTGTGEKYIRIEALARQGGLKVTRNVPLSRLTTIGTGGTASLHVRVDTLKALKELMPCLGNKWFVLGAGSNLLISDRPFNGVIVQLGKGFRSLRLRAGSLVCGAAIPLSRLVNKAILAGFSRFEELSGIPGTVGGAAAMNAGTHVQDLGGLTSRLWMVDMDGNKRSFTKINLVRGYRRSLAPVAGIVTAMTFRPCLPLGADKSSMAGRAAQLAAERRKKHPWQARTFGSTFKNPPGETAGLLIERAGLKGFRIGGARVSTVHANFIENVSSATSTDVLELIKNIHRTVRERFDVSLEPEVRLLGFAREELGELAGFAPQVSN
ncbi:MAG: UDP-N-acetylmuramate dehydrogenase [Gemmatimonadota bacterium]|nr:UDP-N-acetylmuramate dehydrogenase [Gemmatimonadota bacterium]